MDFNENTLSTLLHKAPDDLAPMTDALDVDKALKDGRRRQRRNRAALSATVTVAAASAVTVGVVLPGSLSPSKTSSPATATPTATATAPSEAPESFNPLELPVNFGWLPTVFRQDNAPGPVTYGAGGPLEVTTNQVYFGAATSSGQGLRVTVAANGVKVRPYVDSSAQLPAKLALATKLAVVSAAPDINGRPAKWVGGGLEWQYATGGWATLFIAGHTTALAGWAENCKDNSPVSATCRRNVAQTTALKNELVKVASNLSWTPTPFRFPYEFTKALPTGWTPVDVVGTVVRGILKANMLDLAPAAIPITHTPGSMEDVLNIQAYADVSGRVDCQGLPGYDATYNGTMWTVGLGNIRLSGSGWLSHANACNAPVDVNGGMAKMSFEAYSAAANTVGEAGVKAIVPLIKFLPANPADWTTSPLPK